MFRTIGTTVDAPNVLNRYFEPLLKCAGLRDIRCHDLRHVCAAILLSWCVHAKFVEELLGHATIAKTLDTYSDVLSGGTAAAMDEDLR